MCKELLRKWLGTGPAGPEGPMGPQGPEGPMGPPGPAGESAGDLTIFPVEIHAYVKDHDVTSIIGREIYGYIRGHTLYISADLAGIDGSPTEGPVTFAPIGLPPDIWKYGGMRAHIVGTSMIECDRLQINMVGAATWVRTAVGNWGVAPVFYNDNKRWSAPNGGVLYYSGGADFENGGVAWPYRLRYGGELLISIDIP